MRQEQQYGNDKRRMINRYLFGVGAVAGLEIIQVDEYSISLEMGLALDCTGREIVVETPAIVRLSDIEGYEEATREEGSETLYLCIRYQEMPAEPVQNITYSAVQREEETEYNKIKESYGLYVTDDEPHSWDETEPPHGQESQEEWWEEEKRYLQERAEKTDKEIFQQGIYLAKVFLVKAGPFYMIDRVENLPGKQYTSCLPWIRNRIHSLEEEVRMLRQWKKETERTASGEQKKDCSEDWQFSDGKALIKMESGGIKGTCYFSAEIPHKLGTGVAQIFLQQEERDSLTAGDGGIFSDYGKESKSTDGARGIQAELAVRQKPDRGTFVIGARILEETEEKELTVYWTAMKNRRRNEFGQGEKRIFIQPGMVSMKVRESCSLSVVCVNMESKRILWKTETEDGGTVDEAGVYRAPNKPGVYQVSAESEEYPNVRAVVFIVVNE